MQELLKLLSNLHDQAEAVDTESINNLMLLNGYSEEETDNLLGHLGMLMESLDDILPGLSAEVDELK